MYLFAAASNHQNAESTCQQQPSCKNSGTQYFGSDKNSKRTCNPCTDKWYQVKDNHKVPKCTKQAFCRKGTYLSTDDKSQKGVCTACPAGQFQDDPDFQGTGCTDCGVTQCPAGKEDTCARAFLKPIHYGVLGRADIEDEGVLHPFTVLLCSRVRVHPNCPCAGSRITGACPVVGPNTIKCEKCEEHRYSRMPHNVENLKDANGDHSITQSVPPFFPFLLKLTFFFVFVLLVVMLHLSALLCLICL